MRRIYSLIYDVFRCNLSQLFSINYDYIYVAKSSVKLWELLIYTGAKERNLMLSRLTHTSFPRFVILPSDPSVFSVLAQVSFVNEGYYVVVTEIIGLN
jgi:hypothetical protein